MKRSSPLILGLLALTAIGLSRASADTFKFKDGRVVRGRVIAEFRDHFFVRLDSELARFVPVREIERVLDDSDQPRTFGERDPSPVFAIDSPVGEVRFVPRSGVAEDVTAQAFAKAGDRVVTGDTGLARVIMPSGVTAKVGPSSRILASATAMDLEQGSVFLTTADTTPFDLTLARGLKVKALAAKVDVARAGTDRTWRIAVHAGEARLESDTFRLGIPAGLAASIEGTDTGIKLSADGSNAGDLEATVGTKTTSLGPGKTLVVDGGVLATARVSGTWRFQKIRGSVFLRSGTAEAGAAARFVNVSPLDLERLRLEDGDGVQTGASSEAVLLRDDGATATLGEMGELAITNLTLAVGSLRVDSLRAPVALATPSGEARLTFSSLSVRRPVAHDTKALDVSVIEGDVKLPAAASIVVLSAGGSVSLRGTEDETSIKVSSGTAQLISTPQVDCGDPVVTSKLDAGRSLTVRALHQDGLAVLLEDSREVGFGPERVAVEIKHDGSTPRLHFVSGALVALAKETRVRFRSEQSTPVAWLPGGEHVRLADARLDVTLEGSTMTFADGTAVTFKDGVESTLHTGEGLAGAAIGQRREDRVEVPRRARVTVGKRGIDHATFKTEGGVTLWIHGGAPAVQARLTAGRDRGIPEPARADVDLPLAFSYTMPGTPPLTVAASRRVVVLATRDGEFVILDDPALIDAAAEKGIIPLAGTGIPPAVLLDTNHLPELLAQPDPASPVK